LSRGKRGGGVVVELHEVLVTGGEWLLGLFDGAHHFCLPCNIALQVTYILVDLIFRIWHQGYYEIRKLVIPLVTSHKPLHKDLVLLIEIGAAVLGSLHARVHIIEAMFQGV
jgi:hypothetical protein